MYIGNKSSQKINYSDKMKLFMNIIIVYIGFDRTAERARNEKYNPMLNH